MASLKWEAGVNLNGNAEYAAEIGDFEAKVIVDIDIGVTVFEATVLGWGYEMSLHEETVVGVLDEHAAKTECVRRLRDWARDWLLRQSKAFDEAVA